MIFVRNTTKARTAKDIEEMAMGMVDDFGNPFEIIELIWTFGKNATYSKTRGYQDTEIKVNRRTGSLEIKHRDAGTGSIMWTRPLGGIGPFQGRLAKTPHNIEMLAHDYRNKMWKIKDPLIEAEVKVLSDKIWAELSKEQREEGETKIKDMTRTRYDSNIMVPNSMAGDAFIEQQTRKELFQREQKIKEREAALAARERRLLQTVEKGEIKPTSYNRDALDKMTVFQLRKLVKESGHAVHNKMGKIEAMDILTGARNSIEEPIIQTTAPEPVKEEVIAG